MKASPQARINRRVLFLSVAVAGAAAVAYRAARPAKKLDGAQRGAGPPQADQDAAPDGVQPATGERRRPPFTIPERPDLPESVLQPYPTQPGEPAQGALPEHPVKRYALKEADESLLLEVLVPEPSAGAWDSELSYRGGLSWQHSGDVPSGSHLLSLSVPAQRLKTGRYSLRLRNTAQRRVYLYRFEVQFE